MRSTLRRQFSWIISGRILAAGIQAASIVLLARTVGPEQFGLLMSVVGFSIVAQAVSDLGVTKLVVRERAADTDPSLVAGGLRLNGRASLALGATVGLVLAALAFGFDSRFLMMLPLAVSAAAEKNADTWLGVALADGDTRLNATNLVGRRLAALMIFVILVMFAVPGVLSYTLALAIAGLGSVAFSRRCVSSRVGLARAPVRVTVSRAAPYWANTVAAQVRNLDTSIVALAANAATAGFYSSASRLISPLNMIPASLAIVMLPHATRNRERPLRSSLRVIAVVVAGTAALYGGLAVLVPYVVPPVLGDDYAPAIAPLQIVLIGLVFGGLNALVGAVMQGRGYPGKVALSAAIASAYCLLVIGFLAAAAGARGAALGLSTAFLLESLLLVSFLLHAERTGRSQQGSR